MPFKNYIVSNFKRQSDMNRPFSSLSFIYLLADASVVDRTVGKKKIRRTLQSYRKCDK